MKKINVIDISATLMIAFIFAFYDYTVLAVIFQIVFISLVTIKTIYYKRKLPLLYISWWILFIVWCATSVLWAKHTETFLSVLISVIQVATIGISIVLYADSDFKINHLIFSMVVSGVLLCVRFFINVPISLWGDEQRLKGFISFYSNTGPMMLSFVSVILFNKYLQRKNIWFIGIITIFFFVMILYGTRKALIIFLFGIIVQTLLSAKRLVKTITYTIFIVLGVISLYYALLSIPLLYGAIGYRIEGMMNSIQGQVGDASTKARLLFIDYAKKLFLESPYIGVGLDGFRYYNIHEMTYSHNNYYELLCNTGIIGLLLYYWFYFVMILKLLPCVRKSNNCLLAFTIITCYIIIDYFNVSYFEELAHVIISFSYALIRLEKSKVVNISEFGQLVKMKPIYN
ncbi:MAG: O-antigen ligase family protein [Candidatus Izemoplasmatales bacterium]